MNSKRFPCDSKARNGVITFAQEEAQHFPAVLAWQAMWHRTKPKLYTSIFSLYSSPRATCWGNPWALNFNQRGV